MISPMLMPEARGSPPQFRHTPLQIIHIVGNFFRIWSVYSMYRYLSQTEASVIVFLLSCLVPATFIFLILQKPWKGRPLSNAQVVPSIVNGGITALYFILWGKGLILCGPLRAILAEYSGAVLGVLSAVLYGQKGHAWRKVSGLLAMLASFYLLSQGWAMATYSPLSFQERSDSEDSTEQVVGGKEMMIPIFAGILSGLRRVLARRVSIKNQLKRRLHSITIASATCFLFPIAIWDLIMGSPSDNSRVLPFSTWVFLSTTLFGVVLIFYVESIAEERLHMVFSSPRHLLSAGGCIIIMEIGYKMDFSLLGFLFCCVILGFVVVIRRFPAFLYIKRLLRKEFLKIARTKLWEDRDETTRFCVTIYYMGYMRPLLWIIREKNLSANLIYQMECWMNRITCLHFQLRLSSTITLMSMVISFYKRFGDDECLCISLPVKP